MGISIVKFQRLDSEAQWGVASGQTISPIMQSFASHREVMAVYFRRLSAAENRLSHVRNERC